MKVYELMEELSKYPAGLEVQINGCLTLAELTNSTEIDVDEDGKSLYSIGGPCYNIDGTESINLYF